MATPEDRLERTPRERTKIKMEQQPKVEEIVDKEETKNHMNNLIEEDKDAILIKLLEETTWINKMNVATELAIKENDKKEEKTDKELVPEEFHKYLDIFSKEKAHQFPKPQLWDHKIKMKEGFEPKSFKNYHLTLAEQIELDKFLKENLEKGYIIPSQSPMASPFSLSTRQKTLTLPGLLVSEWLDNQELLSPSFNFGNHRQTERCKVLHQTGCALGIQQHTN